MPITQIHVCSERATQDFGTWVAQGTTKTIAITITSPRKKHVFPTSKDNSILALKFDDLETNRSGDLVFQDSILFDDKMAKQVRDFVIQWHEQTKDNILLVINCQAGWSRSPAMGMVISKRLGVPVKFLEGDQICPNQLVLFMLDNFWEEK